VMAHYEGKLEGGAERPDGRGLAFLIVFIPLCLSVGGNAGSQAWTLVTRALALDQIRARDWLRVFQRELLMAVALAAALGVLSVARTYWFTPTDVLVKVPDDGFWSLVWVVTFSVMGICLTGALVGAMLPLGIKSIGWDPALMSGPSDGPWYYQQVALGYNYRLTDLQCALGISQMRKLGRFVERRRELAARYDAAFATVSSVVPLAIRPGVRSSYHLYVVRLVRRPGEALEDLAGRRKALFLGLRERGIQPQVHYIPVHRQPDYVRAGPSGGRTGLSAGRQLSP